MIVFILLWGFFLFCCFKILMILCNKLILIDFLFFIFVFELVKNGKIRILLIRVIKII